MCTYLLYFSKSLRPLSPLKFSSVDIWSGSVFKFEKYFWHLSTIREIWTSHCITRVMYNCAHLRSTKESVTFEYDIWWYWVIRRQYWLVLCGTASVWVKFFLGWTFFGWKYFWVKIFSWWKMFWGKICVGWNFFDVKFLGGNFLGEFFFWREWGEWRG